MDSIQGLHVMTLANSIIGVSILAMPYCFKQCGIILSIVLLLFSSVLSRLSCHFLIKSAIKAKLKTFENLAFYAFGPLGKFVVEIGLIGFLIGTCIAFFVVMGDLGPQIVAQLTETHATSQLRTLILVSLAVFCILPLGLLKNVESLSGVCTATIGFYGCLVLKIISESAPHIASGDWVENVDFWKPSGILQCIPIFSMALFCQTQLFEIYQSMSNASLDKMNAVVRLATNICTCVYIFVGIFGYIAVSGHGASIGGNILLAFRPSLITEIIKIGFVLSVAFSFPLVIFPCRTSIYSLLYKSSYSLLDTNNMSQTHSSATSSPLIYIPANKFRIITILIVVTSLIIGIIIPNIELVLGLVGSTIGVMICVIFPATSFICLTTKNTNERIGAQIMLCIGVLVMVLGSYANLYAIEEVAINPIDAVKSIQIENIPLQAEINSFEEKHKNDDSNLNVQILKNDVKLENLNNNISKEPVKEQKVDVIEKVAQIPESKEENLNEIRHEPVQPEEPIEEPRKDDETPEKKEPEKVNKTITIEKIVNQVEKLEEKVKLDANIDAEAIKKEDAEVLEQKKKEDKKSDDILENLQKHNELQQEMVEEQKKILDELKELKKIAATQQKPQKQQVAENPEVPKIIEESIKKEINVKNQSIETNIMQNENKIIIANENNAETKLKSNLTIKESPKLEILENVEKSVENLPEIIPKEPKLKDTVIQMLENQINENNRENQSKNDEKMENLSQNLTKNKEIIIDNENVNKESDKAADSDKENVNSIRRDILSASNEIPRVKRDVIEDVKRDGLEDVKRDGLEDVKRDGLEDVKEELKGHCKNSSESKMIIGKDDETRYDGKFMARELKSVYSDNETENP